MDSWEAMMRKNEYSMEELLPIVAELARKYTSNESTSVTYEVARGLMQSVIYCIEEVYHTMDENRIGYRDESVLSDNTSDERYVMLQNFAVGLPNSVNGIASAKEAFQKGLEYIKRKVETTRKLFNNLASCFYSFSNHCYYDTIIKGMPAFFERYNPLFASYDHILTLDYPLLVPIQGMCGIDLIHEYLQRVYLEQEFLNIFPKEKVVSLLNRYNNDFEELIINLSEPVLQYAIACQVVGRDIKSLELDEEDISEFQSFLLSSKSYEELENALTKEVNNLVEKFFHGDILLSRYLRSSLPDYVAVLKSCDGNDRIYHILPYVVPERNMDSTHYEMGTQMSDEDLRLLIERIEECQLISGKLVLIRENVTNLDDYKEILNECFYEADYKEVFALLTEQEYEVLRNEIKEKLDFDQELAGWERYLYRN
jgi:hypothetical protein